MNLKTFLYILTTLRDGASDEQVVFGGNLYYHPQLLMVIDAVDAEQAALALNTQITGSFDRSSSNLPTIYYVGKPGEVPIQKVGEFFFSIKEPERGDERKFPDLATKIRFKVAAPQQEVSEQKAA